MSTDRPPSSDDYSQKARPKPSRTDGPLQNYGSSSSKPLPPGSLPPSIPQSQGTQSSFPHMTVSQPRQIVRQRSDRLAGAPGHGEQRPAPYLENRPDARR